jgi:group I intron endonuclease
VIIYRIFNKINGKSYIGQSVNSFDKRYTGNKWWKYTHNEILKNSIMKNGKEQFDFEILEDGVSTIEELNRLELYYAEKFNSYRPLGYNIRGCGDNKFVDDVLKKHLSSFRIGKDYRPKNKNVSNYKGVYWRESKKSWMCRFDNKIIKKTKYCSSEIEAAEIFDKVCLYLIGKDCFINFEEKRKDYLASNLEDFYLNSFLPIKTKRKDGYYKDLSETREKILPLIDLSISEISNSLNISKRRINWCIKKYKLK